MSRRRSRWWWLLLLVPVLLAAMGVPELVAALRAGDEYRRQLAERQREILDLSGLFRAAVADRERLEALAGGAGEAARDAVERAEATEVLAAEIHTERLAIDLPCGDPIAADLELPAGVPPPDRGGVIFPDIRATVPPAAPLFVDTTVHALVAADELGGFHLAGNVVLELERGAWRHTAVQAIAEGTEIAVAPELAQAWRDRHRSKRERRTLFAGGTSAGRLAVGGDFGRRRFRQLYVVLWDPNPVQFGEGHSSSATDRLELLGAVGWRF